MRGEKQTAAAVKGDGGSGPQADNDSDQTQVIQNFDALADGSFELKTDQLVCDLRDVMLDIVKTVPDVWGKLKQDQQIDIAAGLERAAEGMVNSAVMLIAAKGQDVVTAKLEKFTFKSGEVQITLKAVGHEQLAMDLAKLDGQAVLVVSSDAAPFYGMTVAETMADAPELFNEAEPVAEDEEEEKPGEPVELGGDEKPEAAE